MLFFKGKLVRALHWAVVALTWRHIILLILVHWHAAWLLQLWTEPGAEFASYDVFWYFYFVTATTVGYGDFSPALLGSRLSTVFFVGLPGIALIGVVIGKIGSLFVDISDKVRRGLMTLHLKDHTIVVGDGTAHTLTLLRNLISDQDVGQVVLVSERSENPMNGELAGFVSGDINDRQIQERACFATARSVIVLGDDDTTVTGRTIAVMDCTGDKTEILAYLQYENSARRLNAQTDTRVRTVSSVSMDLVVQEVLDPGAAGFVSELLRNCEGGTYECLTIPDGIESTWKDVGCLLMDQDLNPLSLYVNGKPITMPLGKSQVVSGDCIGVAAKSQAQIDAIDWSSLKKITA